VCTISTRARAGDEEARRRHRGQELDDGEVECVDRDRLEVRVEVIAVEPVEAIALAALAPEELDDTHASEALWR